MARSEKRPGVYLAIKNFDKWQTREASRKWLRISTEVFQDVRIASLRPKNISKLSWIGLLIAAKKEDNHLPWDPEVIMERAGLGKITLDLDKLLALGLIEIVAAVSEKPADTPRPAKKKREPVIMTWVQQAVQAWEKRFGAGSGGKMYGRIGSALKPLVEANMVTPVMIAWGRYLDPSQNSTDEKFLSPELFASKYSTWSGTGASSFPVLPQDEVYQRRQEVKVG